MKIKTAGDNVLYCTVQVILLVLMCNAHDVCRKVELPVVFGPGLRRNLFSIVAAAQKDVKIVITKGGSILDLGSFSLQLRTSDNLDHFNLAIAQKIKRIESSFCTVLGKTFGNETVLTASVPRKPIARSGAIIIIFSRVQQRQPNVHNS